MTNDVVAEDSLALEQRRIEPTRRIQLIKAGEERILCVWKEDLEIFRLVHHASLGLVAEEEALVGLGIDEQWNLGKVALRELERWEVSDLDQLGGLLQQ